MLSNICDINAVWKLRVNMLHDHLRADSAISSHRKRILLIPDFNLFHPLGSLLRFRPFDQFFKCSTCIRNNRNIYDNVSRDGCRIDIDMHDLGIRCKFIQITGNTIVKSCSDGKKHVTFTDCHIGCIFSMHTAVADIQRMRRRNCAFAHDGCDNRDIFFLCKCLQCHIGTRNIDSATGKDQRLLCRFQKLICFLELTDMYTVDRLVATDIHMIRILRRTGRSLDILWNIDKNRTRFTGARDIERHLDDLAKICTISDRYRILCDTSCHTNDINLLERIVSDESEWNLTGKAYKRNAVIMRIRQSRDRVGRSRSASH